MKLTILPLARFARAQQLHLRFIEFMPLDADRNWQLDQLVDAETLRATLEAEFGPLQEIEAADQAQPAVDFAYQDGLGKVGLIHSVSAPFCDRCDRVRLTADGQIRNCLFSQQDWDVRKLLRSGEDDQAIAIWSSPQQPPRRSSTGSVNQASCRRNGPCTRSAARNASTNLSR